MLDATLQAQLKGYLQRLTQPVELVASLDDRPASAEMRELLEEIAGLSELVSLRVDGSDDRRPSFNISRAGAGMGVRFARSAMLIREGIVEAVFVEEKRGEVTGSGAPAILLALQALAA